MADLSGTIAILQSPRFLWISANALHTLANLRATCWICPVSAHVMSWRASDTNAPSCSGLLLDRSCDAMTSLVVVVFVRDWGVSVIERFEFVVFSAGGGRWAQRRQRGSAGG